MPRCNPFGYGTDAGPRHLEGGFYGPEYAGKLTTNKDGIHGVAVCEDPATGRYRLHCPAGHTGPIMDLCQRHAAMIVARYSACCTACIHVPQERAIQEEMNTLMREITAAMLARDIATMGRKKARLDDLRHSMDELNRRGISVKRPMELVEIS
jgi:hypothetical protein